MNELAESNIKNVDKMITLLQTITTQGFKYWYKQDTDLIEEIGSKLLRMRSIIEHRFDDEIT